MGEKRKRGSAMLEVAQIKRLESVQVVLDASGQQVGSQLGQVPGPAPTAHPIYHSHMGEWRHRLSQWGIEFTDEPDGFGPRCQRLGQFLRLPPAVLESKLTDSP